MSLELNKCLERYLFWIGHFTYETIIFFRNRFIDEELKYKSVLEGIKDQHRIEKSYEWRISYDRVCVDGCDPYYYRLGRLIQLYIAILSRRDSEEGYLPHGTIVRKGEIRDKKARIIREFYGPLKVERMCWYLKALEKWCNGMKRHPF